MLIPSTTTLREVLIGAVVTVLIIAACVAGGYYLGRPGKVVETAAPAQTQGDGSEVLARTDSQPDAKPAHQIPKGGTVERIEKVTVTPGGTGLVLKDGKCPPVTVDLSIVRMPDHTRRVVASSPDGEVAGIDIPVETPDVPEEHLLAVGLSYDPIKQTPGAWVERDIGRIRIGAEINQTRIQVGGPTGVEARVRVGWSF